MIVTISRNRPADMVLSLQYQGRMNGSLEVQVQEDEEMISCCLLLATEMRVASTVVSMIKQQATVL